MFLRSCVPCGRPDGRRRRGLAASGAFRVALTLVCLAFGLSACGDGAGAARDATLGPDATPADGAADGAADALVPGPDVPPTADAAPGDLGGLDREPATPPRDALSNDGADPELGGGDAPAGDAPVGDTPDAGPPPSATPCRADEACNARLLPDGACPGACIPQVYGRGCPGFVSHGLCQRLEPLPDGNPDADFGDLHVHVAAAPPLAYVGETHDVSVVVTNRGSRPFVVDFRSKHPDTWVLEDADFPSDPGFTLQPEEERVLTARMRAVAEDALMLNGGVMLTLGFGPDLSYDVRSLVAYPAAGNVACGEWAFPETYCPGGVPDCYANRLFYTSGRCCADVFYPATFCCADPDCLGARCVDGRCVTQAPNGLANTLPVGHQRFLLVRVDLDEPSPGGPCENRAAALRGPLRLDEAVAYFDAVIEARTGLRDVLAVDWTVFAGLRSDDFAAGDFLYAPYVDALEAHLAEAGCLDTFADFDKVIVASPLLDLAGTAGQAFDGDKIAVFVGDEPLLLAHELAHTFGASDLYLDLGGQFQYLFDLMGNNLGGFGPPEDGVLWAEIGLGDLDRNGVIDGFDVAAHPEALVVAALEAFLTDKRSLEIHLRLGGLEAGGVGRVIVNQLDLALPEFALQRDVYDSRDTKVVAFDEHEVDLDRLATAPAVAVRVQATLPTTDRNFARKWLTLDETVSVPLVRP